MAELRSLIVVLGDQLDLDAAAFDGFDPAFDAVWMAEVAEESTQVWSSKPRTVMFLAAMRHFALALHAAGRPLHYTRLDADGNGGSLGAQLQADLARLRPAGLVMTAPGDWRVLQAIKAVAEARQLPLDIREDRHFFSSIRDFAAHAKGRKSLRMEYFYREQRKRHQVLMQGAGQLGTQDSAPSVEPVGGQWNFDADKREAFGAAGPGAVPPRTAFEPDGVTREVITLVNTRFAQHPGQLDSFAWPVTRAQALQSLQAFIAERLPLFGRYQDAMWPGDPWLYHAPRAPRAVRHRANALANLIPVNTRHHHVEQYQIMAVLLELRQRIFPTVDILHVEAGVPQCLGGHAAHQQVVVDQQQAGPGLIVIHAMAFCHAVHRRPSAAQPAPIGGPP